MGEGSGGRECALLRLVTQSCLTVGDPTDCSLPGSSVHGILQARILEWVAMPSSRGSSQARDGTQISRIVGRSLPSEPPGSPREGMCVYLQPIPKVVQHKLTQLCKAITLQ